MDEQRLEDIWRSIEGYRGAKRVTVTKPDVLVDDVYWMIEVIRDQNRELEAWRKEGMI
jgi:hypothetical protein